MKEFRFFGEDNYWQYTDQYISLDRQIQRFLIGRVFASTTQDASLRKRILVQNRMSPTITRLTISPEIATELMSYMGFSTVLVFRNTDVTVERNQLK